MLIRRLAEALPVEQVKDCRVSPDGKLLAVRQVENLALRLLALASGRHVNGFKASGVLFYDFVSPGAGKTLLVTVNSRGSLILYEYIRGVTHVGFYVRVVTKTLPGEAGSAEPILMRFEEERDAEEEESINCWEVSLERIGLAMKREKLLAVQELHCTSRHIVLVLRGGRNQLLAAVFDVTLRMVALRRWWFMEDGESLDMDVALGKREDSAVTDLGPRSLGTDVPHLPEIVTEPIIRASRPWLPPMEKTQANYETTSSGAEHASASAAATTPPLGMIATTCDSGRKRIWVGHDGIYLPDVDRRECLRATLIFQGPDAAFELANANKWDTMDVHLFALELAFKNNDATAAQKSLAELPITLRPRAHELAAAVSSTMHWEVCKAWVSACAKWAVQDSDEEAANAVKRVRLNQESDMAASGQKPLTQSTPKSVRRGLAFDEKNDAAAPRSPSKQKSGGSGRLTLAWKPKKALRKQWDGKSDEDIVRMACLEGSLSKALAYLRWRGGATSSTIILELAVDATYRTLCKGQIEEAKIMMANAGSENVEAELEMVRVQTLRPSLRQLLGGFRDDERDLEQLEKLYTCVGGVVDDFPQLGRWVPEDKSPNEKQRPYLRTSLAWVKEWEREGARDVLLEAVLRKNPSGDQKLASKASSSSSAAPPTLIPEAPAWDPLNARVLSYFARHGDARAARKWCAHVKPEHAEEVKRALEGAAPHARHAVLLECAKAGVHPFGVDTRIACAAGAMLRLEVTGAECVNLALQLRRSSMLHHLLDAGAVYVASEGSQNTWTRFALAMRDPSYSVPDLATLCAALLHGAQMSSVDADVHSLGRPLISVPFDVYKGLRPDPDQLSIIGCPDLWSGNAPSHAMQTSFEPKSLLSKLAEADPDRLERAVKHPFDVYRPPTAEQWLQRGMPFRAAEASGTKIETFFAQHFPPQSLPPQEADWISELLESSLDPSRPVFNVNRHFAMLFNGEQCQSRLTIPQRASVGPLELTFQRAWEQLRMRSEAYDLLPASGMTDVEIMAQLDSIIQTESSWDIAHFLSALKAWKPDEYGALQTNWKMICDHKLDPTLLHASKDQVGAALRGRGLWDAARALDPTRRDATTLAQAERLGVQWERVAALFESQKLSLELRERFWVARAAERDDLLDLSLLSFAKESSGSAELEARFHIAKEGGWSWKDFQAAPKDDRLALIEKITGSLAAKGCLKQDAKKLCETVKLWPEVMKMALNGGHTTEQLDEALTGQFGSGWRDWAAGAVLRSRAHVDEKQAPLDVTAQLAGEGQLALARDWAIHFKPDAVKLSRELGKRFVEALRKHYPVSLRPQETVSLASPSSRAALSSPGIDVSWSDGAWADYVSVGGSPKDMGDVLFDALTGESSHVVRAVELCVRTYSCYALAINVSGMDAVLNVAVRLAHELADNGLYAHLIRLLTGMGNYTALEFCIGVLLDAEQFELILRKNPMMSYSARIDLRQSLYRYLRDKRPQDVHYMNLLLLSFNMFREIGENLEAKAQSVIKLGRGRPSMLLVAFGHLIDAADSFRKERCLQSAERALRLAHLVKLQIQRPNLQLLYENGADIAKLTSFSEASVVAAGLQLKDWWPRCVYEQGVAGSNPKYLEEAMASLSLTKPPAILYHDLLQYCRQQNASEAVMTSVLKTLPDVFLAFDLGMEFGVASFTDDLATTNSSIKVFKLLGRQ